MTPEERIAALEVEMRQTREDLHEIKEDVRAIRQTLAEARGGWKLILAVGSASAVLGGLAAKLGITWRG